MTSEVGCRGFRGIRGTNKKGSHYRHHRSGSNCLLIKKKKSLKQTKKPVDQEKKKSSGLQRAQTSILLNTFRINWNVICAPGLLTRHQNLTSVMLFWQNGCKSPQPHCKTEWKAFPHSIETCCYNTFFSPTTEKNITVI